MKRRSFLLQVPACGILLACSSAREQGKVVSPYSEIAVSTPKANERPTIVVFMPRTPQAMEVWTGLRDELARDFKLVAVEVEGRDSVDVFIQAMRRHRASAIVLM